LLGILSLKFANNIDHKDIASYFVPADTIKTFIPIESEMARLQASVAPKLAEQSLPSLLVTPSSSVAFSGPQGGPFSPSVIDYRISASIGTVGYSIRTPAWLTASSNAGVADTNGITITLDGERECLKSVAGYIWPCRWIYECVNLVSSAGQGTDATRDLPE
jgi:hypothetical protein